MAQGSGSSGTGSGCALTGAVARAVAQPASQSVSLKQPPLPLEDHGRGRSHGAVAHACAQVVGLEVGDEHVEHEGAVQGDVRLALVLEVL